jgi:hypothetical protein
MSERAGVRRSYSALSLFMSAAAGLALSAIACASSETVVVEPGPAPPPKVEVNAEPQITLKGEAVMLDGAQVGDISAALKEGRPMKIDALYARLKERREAWASAHPHETYAGRCRIELDPQTPDAAWRSVVITAFFSGHTAMTIACPGTSADIRASIPLPPERGGPTRPIMLTVRPSRFEAVWIGATKSSRRLEAPRHTEAAAANGSHDLRELSEALRKECGASPGPCFDVIGLRTLAPLSFGELVAVALVIKPVWGGSEPAPVFDFMRGTTLAGSSESAGGPGVPTGSGRIEPGEVQRVVRANFNKFVTCYKEGQTRDPKLAGRVVVRFVIDPTGHVPEASSVTSESGHGGAAGSAVSVTSLPDPKVVACVVEAYRSLTFPAPQGGRAIIAFPIELSPSSR